ncbi:peroxide stress protein YaaA [Halocynthiibacter namhaensis]|uniref:peroxide stress protein YaaA n=1 Tax=Halocynthiibacter namhaensis TaxID=1290553 RepID=UPI000578F98A|nr:peroxide stress protein YaaA [Halocynthiibacter namhaensis]
MLALLSPAKSLDFSAAPEGVAHTMPDFQEDANRLALIAKKLSVEDLRKLMKISEGLAQLNVNRFNAFGKSSTAENAKQASLAFTGDTYQGLQAWDFDASDFTYAQDHLRILSGLYGLLRPLDLMQPYRLEMGSRLENKAGKNLYAYWGDRLAKAVDQISEGPAVVNLASNEYFKAAGTKALKTSVITPEFREERGNELKMIGFYAKRARGSMARYMVQNRVDRPEGLKDFNTDGYGFRADLSDAKKWVFTRSEAA